MSVSYQSWEMASGPPVAYKMAGRTNGCAVADSSKGSNFSSFRVQDTMSRGFGEAPKSSHYRMFSPQDSVMRGMSALSLRGQSQLETESPSEESRSASLGALCCGPPELFRCMSPRSNESSPIGLAQSAGCWKHLSPSTSGFVSSSEVCSEALSSQTQKNVPGNSLHVDFEAVSERAPLNIVHHASAPVGFDCLDEGYPCDDLGRFSYVFRSSTSSSHSIGMGPSKESSLELLDTISESSISSGNDMPLASSTSSGEASQLSDDTEAQSAYKEPAEFSSSVGASSLPRKGLSKFYAGKSRSFSCLSDVVSVKDLAKSEIPHAKKRRFSSSSSGLPPLQKGAASISKKTLHSGKSTLALAVAMNKEEYKAQASSVGAQRYQKSVVPSRSYSLSDLQGATGSLFFIG